MPKRPPTPRCQGLLPTEKQLQLLSELGWDEVPRTRNEASTIIGELIEKRRDLIDNCDYYDIDMFFDKD